MNKKQFGVLFILSLLPFMFYSALRPDLVGADGYGYLSYSCQTKQQINLIENLVPPLSKLFFLNVPCNVAFIKFFEWLIFFSCILILAFAGKLIDERDGWLYPIFLALCLAFTSEFFKLEEISLGYFFVFLSFYYLVKYFKGLDALIVQQHNERNKYYYLASILMAGLFWKGAILLLFPVFFVIPILLPIILGIYLLFWNQIAGGILIAGVQESQPFIGLIFFLLLIPFLILSAYTNRKFLPFIVWFTILLIVSLKFILLLLPFTFYGFKKALSNQKYYKLIKYTLLFYSIVCLITFGILTIQYPPTPEHKQAINYAIELADGNTICNEWSYGYWIIHFGGKAKKIAGHPNPDFNACTGIILTNNQEHVNANLLYENSVSRIWRK